LHDDGQVPGPELIILSHASPDSTTLLPQTAEQSLSFTELQLPRQQPSP
jgi:hypothetical protein